MEKLPYQEGVYEDFLIFIGHLVDYVDGKAKRLRKYSEFKEDWEGSPYQHTMTPEKALQELNANDGNYDSWVDVVQKPNGEKSHIINVTTTIDDDVYIFTYDLSLPVSDSNGTHFYLVNNES